MLQELVKPILAESRLANKYSYVYATDPMLIDQFYQLLEKIYQKYISKKFIVTPFEREFDKKFGRIVVALNEHGRVVGGSRIIISTLKNRCLLPLESPSLILQNKFPELELSRHNYSEWGRYIVEDNIPHKIIVSENIARMCIRVSLAYSCKYQFFITKYPLMIRLRRLFKKINIPFDMLFIVARNE